MQLTWDPAVLVWQAGQIPNESCANATLTSSSYACMASTIAGNDVKAFRYCFAHG